MLLDIDGDSSVADPESDSEEIANEALSSDVEVGLGLAPGNDRFDALNNEDDDSSNELPPVSSVERHSVHRPMSLALEESDNELDDRPRPYVGLSDAEDDNEAVGDAEAGGDNDAIGDAEAGGDNDAIGDGNVESSEPTPVEPKKKRPKKPQHVLNLDRLKGPRGLVALEDMFKDFKWKGRDHEIEDLNSMMHVYEHWAHRMFPQYKFEDCIDQITHLGRKKESYTLIKRFRLGMLNTEVPVQLFDDDNVEPMNVDDPAPPEDAFDSLMNEADQPPKLTDDTQAPVFFPPPAPKLTAEQRERIERNRRAAEERCLAKLRDSVP